MNKLAACWIACLIVWILNIGAIIASAGHPLLNQFFCAVAFVLALLMLFFMAWWLIDEPTRRI